MKLTTIVLAAGQGTRMNSDLPKVMHPVAGRPMVRYVVDAARTLEPVDIIVIVGHGAEHVRQAVGSGVTYVTQEERLGTGHAVQQAAAAAAGRGETVLVLRVVEHYTIPVPVPIDEQRAPSHSAPHRRSCRAVAGESLSREHGDGESGGDDEDQGPP